MLRCGASCPWYRISLLVYTEVADDRTARNVLVLSLLMDNSATTSDEQIWNIYHHVYLDKSSLHILCIQARKLVEIAASFQDWHSSIYGKSLRFCDEATLRDLREIWQSYDLESQDEAQRRHNHALYESEFKKAAKVKRDKVGQSLILTGLRSAAPASLAAFDDLSKSYHEFWQSGITKSTKGPTPHVNPMFAAVLQGSATLHYGTDPLLGYHLAAAHTPLELGSSVRVGNKGPADHRVSKAARLQFKLWGQAFKKKVRQGMIVRFFTGDALRFCHALQLRRSSSTTNSVNMPRKTYDAEPLMLGPMYQDDGDGPVAFNMIDTSNLIDHLGGINLLVAAAPLLEKSNTATLLTDSLVKKAKSIAAFIDELLCGHFQTMSLLLGLSPLEYYANATGVSFTDEAMVDEVLQMENQGRPQEGQRYIRLAWNRIPTDVHKKHSQQLLVKPGDIAMLLYQIYLKMFQDEDMNRLMTRLTPSEIQNIGLPNSHRGSFVTLLAYLRTRLDVDWSQVIRAFSRYVEDNTTLLIGAQYLQELYAIMYACDVHTTDTLHAPSATTKGPGYYSSCSVTLRVPRANLRIFTSKTPDKMGTPPVQCVIQSAQAAFGAGWQNFFACVQLAFGKPSTLSDAAPDGPALSITPDKKGWSGDSDLFVFFYVPQQVLTQEPEKALISFALMAVPMSQMLFMKDLGPLLKVYETTLGDKKNVFISKYWPNQVGLPRLGSSSMLSSNQDDHSLDNPVTATMNLSTQPTRCQSLTSRLTLRSEKAKAVLKDGALVTVAPKTPYTSEVEFEGHKEPFAIMFPGPIVQSKCKTRIARTSSYVELEAPLLTDVLQGPFVIDPFPITQAEDQLVLRNLPYLNLDVLPIIDLQNPHDNLSWLTTHTSLAMSSRERKLREQAMLPGAPPTDDPRTNFKDGLFSMYMHFSGLQGSKQWVFGLNNPNQGGISILIFISSLRLDAANHTVVLDGAILPLTLAILPKLYNQIAKITDQICQININDEETNLWKHLLPAYVERARTWKHDGRKCEYRTKGQIPLSLEQGTSPICSCGMGLLHPRFMSNVRGFENFFRHYATRVAISPLFACPLVELSTDIEFPSSAATAPPTLPPSSSSTLPVTPHTNSPTAIRASAHACQNCGKKDTAAGVHLMACAKCKRVKYCSKECQKEGWKGHRKVCV